MPPARQSCLQLSVRESFDGFSSRASIRSGSCKTGPESCSPGRERSEQEPSRISDCDRAAVERELASQQVLSAVEHLHGADNLNGKAGMQCLSRVFGEKWANMRIHHA